MRRLYVQHQWTADFHLYRKWDSVFTLEPCKHRGDNEQAAVLRHRASHGEATGHNSSAFQSVLATARAHEALLP